MGNVGIKRAIERVPGGMMVVPLLVGAVVATLFPTTPKVFRILHRGAVYRALPILAVFYVCMGASIDFRATPYIVKKGGTLLLVKVLVAMALGIVFGRFLGEAPVTAGFFAGLSTLAVVAAMNDTNGGLYMALMGQYGRPRDVGAYTVMCLESGPFLTMVTLVSRACPPSRGKRWSGASCRCSWACSSATSTVRCGNSSVGPPR